MHRAMSEPTPSAAPANDFQQLAQVVENPKTSSWALTGLLILAMIAALYFTRDVLLPIVLALVLSMVLAPAVRGMWKLHIPTALAAGIVVSALLALFVGSAYQLAAPASTWLDRAPQGMRQIGVKLRHITGQVKDVTDATAKVQDMTQNMTGVGNDKRTQQFVLAGPTLADVLVGAAKKFAVTAISTLVLLYFLLASGDMFLRKTIAVTPRLADKKRAVDITRQIEAEVCRYLFTVTMINAGLGGAVALALYLLGVPNPMLWGVMVTLFNFVPYLGDIASLSVLTIVGLLSFDPLWRCLLVPGVFSLLTAAEGYLITPLILGKRLSLNPVVIVLSVLFWGWLWGIPGAVLAIPILVALKTLCDRVEPLQVFAEFLSA